MLKKDAHNFADVTTPADEPSLPQSESAHDRATQSVFDRRTLLVQGGRGIAGALLASAATAGAQTASNPPVAPVDRGMVEGKKVEFPAIHADTDLPGGGPPNADPADTRVGFAVLGLGRLSLEEILPAFSACKHARVTALISGDDSKAKTIAAQYGIRSTYTYETMEQLRNNPEVQAVYIVTPNSTHREYTEAVARLGKHVLCEKPMTVSAADAEAMIEACNKAKVQLMVAYRIQYEHNNRYLMDMVRGGKLGTVRTIHAVNVQNQGAPDQWRQIRKLSGGGSLPDIGLYCLNTVRAVTGEEPVEITATTHSPADDPRFREVEDLVSFTLRFPSGIVASCTSCYSAHKHADLQVMGSDAVAHVADAFNYSGQKLTVSRRDGIAEVASEYTQNPSKQFALEIDHFAECIRSGKKPRTGGAEGLQDQKLMTAIYQAAQTGRPVQLPAMPGLDATRGPALPPLGLG
ncbi:Gfo/Idh/MocA family protein [Acidipila sp. EB88]|uniref:Gfo/Idh/MocA family protein n=1 Tax=Acidipila sp. EB88 TaxID=2305226 RepID=UPI000F5E27EE|nr:Gfo/Idh/MocA family oxidoreductase [Acidipila sp. EB88]RRA48300.1 gfo/Idh/MocA family oxidoreductase [Acidipila sp. EB88]